MFCWGMNILFQESVAPKEAEIEGGFRGAQKLFNVNIKIHIARIEKNAVDLDLPNTLKKQLIRSLFSSTFKVIDFLTPNLGGQRGKGSCCFAPFVSYHNSPLEKREQILEGQVIGLLFLLTSCFVPGQQELSRLFAAKHT